MSFKKKLLTAGGVVALIASGILINTLRSGDQPIYVGDGSIKLHYDGPIDNNPPNEIEPHAFLHKVRSISIGDYNQPPSSTLPVKNRKWTLTSDPTPNFKISLRSYVLDLENGVPAYCPSGWSGAAPDYVCTGSKLTPITVTFSDGNCPGASSRSCKLSCPSGSCQMRLEYK